MKFFDALPCTTVICITLLGGALVSLLRELLNYPSSVTAWVLLSRFDLKSQPVVILLPVDSVLEGTLLLSAYGILDMQLLVSTLSPVPPTYGILNKFQIFIQKF